MRDKMRKLYHDGHAIKGLEVIQRSHPFGNDARCGLGDVAYLGRGRKKSAKQRRLAAY